MKRLVMIVFAIGILIGLTACGDSTEGMVLLQQESSPNEDYIAYVYNYSLGATNPSGEKVYLSRSDGTDRTEVFNALGYDCSIAWTDNTSLVIMVLKSGTQDYFRINTMMDKWNDVVISYN